MASNQSDKVQDARRTCQEMSADLPIIKSEMENTFIVSMMSNQKDWVWLGMRRDNGTLLWFDGISAERTNVYRYTAWKADEPSGESCAYLSFYDQKWNDNPCYFNPGQAPFVLCQKSGI